MTQTLDAPAEPEPGGIRIGLAEPLLWFAVAVGALWFIVVGEIGIEPVEHGGGVGDGHRKVERHLGLQSAVLAVALLPGAGLALAGLRATRSTPSARWWALLVGVALIPAGVGFGQVHDIQEELVGGYVAVTVAAGVGLILVTAGRWPEREPAAGGPGVAGTIAALVCGVGTLVAATMVLDVMDWGWVGVYEEDQPAWDYGTPAVLLATGLAAATVAGYRRRWGGCALAVLLAGASWGALMALASWAV